MLAAGVARSLTGALQSDDSSIAIPAIEIVSLLASSSASHRLALIEAGVPAHIGYRLRSADEAEVLLAAQCIRCIASRVPPGQ